MLKNLFLKRKKKKNIFDYNILGLDNAVDVDDIFAVEKKKFIKSFYEFKKETDKKWKFFLDKYLKGNSTDEEYQQIMKTSSTLEEAFKKIQGRSSDDEHQKHKREIIDMIIYKLKELKECGESKKIYKDDYRELKHILLEFLFSFFRSAEDMENLEYAIPILKEMEIIPGNSTREEIVQYCPVGRWY